MVTSASTSVLLSSAAISAVCCPVPPKTDRLTSIVCGLHTTVMSVMNLYFFTTAFKSHSASAAFVLILPSRESPKPDKKSWLGLDCFLVKSQYESRGSVVVIPSTKLTRVP